MVHMALPKNSQVKPGKVWPKPADTSKLTEFHIYRWSPDDDRIRVSTLIMSIAMRAGR